MRMNDGTTLQIDEKRVGCWKKHFFKWFCGIVVAWRGETNLERNGYMRWG